MTTTLTRGDLTFTVLAADTEKRTVTGLALPYNEDIQRPDWMAGTRFMRWAPGCAILRDNAQLFYGHDHLDLRTPIGRVISAEDTPEGLRITAHISATAKGDEIYTLLKDGVITQFSIGFNYVTNHVEDVDTDHAVLVHDEIDVFEVSVVPDPAFQTAQIENVLSATPPTKEGTMPETQQLDPATFMSREDGATLASSIDNLEARIATLNLDPASTGYDVPFGSYGEYVQALASGDDAAQRLFLDYAGGVIADLGDVVKDGWLGDVTRWVESARRVLNLFDKGGLPESGMGVEYAFLDEDTTQITEQVAEGDLLAFGKITFDTDRAPIKTYGGYGEVSRQEVERSPLSVIETYFKALTIRYAKVTEGIVRGAAVAAAAHEVTADLTDADGWLRFVSNASFHLDDKGLKPEFILVGRDVWLDLITLRDGEGTDAARVLKRSDGQVNITGLSADLWNVPVVPINTGATTGVTRVCNSFALRSFESGGAPLRLADEDVTNLTKAFSVYGYLATAVIDPQAIVKPGA